MNGTEYNPWDVHLGACVCGKSDGECKDLLSLNTFISVVLQFH